MSRYRIIERVGDHYERVETYADLERHHPSAARQLGRDYAMIDGRLEEIRHLEDGRLLVKKDFILLRDPAGPVYVPAPISGYIHHLKDPTNAIRIYDRPGGQDAARMLAQSLHMQYGSSPPHGSWIDYGMPLGRMGDVGSRGSVHVHLEAEPAQYRRYIEDIRIGNITPERHPAPRLLQAGAAAGAPADFREVQRMLNQLGYGDQRGQALRLDGTAGPRSLHAVRAFQHDHRLSVDGVAGRRTTGAMAVALLELPLRRVAGDAPLLRQGATGDEVRALQSVLGRLGYEPGSPLLIDGRFGPATATAVRDFQLAHGLAPDRVVGARTWAALHGSLDHPLVSERTHPQQPLFQQAEAALDRLPDGSGLALGGQWRNLAANLALAAHRDGLNRIDQVVVGMDGQRLFAVQGGAQDPGQRHAFVDLAAVAQPPLAASTQAAALQTAVPLQPGIEPPARQRALAP